jgi:hypothetical protein
LDILESTFSGAAGGKVLLLFRDIIVRQLLGDAGKRRGNPKEVREIFQ